MDNYSINNNNEENNMQNEIIKSPKEDRYPR